MEASEALTNESVMSEPAPLGAGGAGELVRAVRRLPDRPWFNVVYRKGTVSPSGQEHRG